MWCFLQMHPLESLIIRVFMDLNKNRGMCAVGGKRDLFTRLSAHRVHTSIFVPAHKNHERSKIPK